MRCQSCSAENQPAAKFCVECGAGFHTLCVKCGFTNPPAAKFCQECGAALKPSSAIQTARSGTFPTGPAELTTIVREFDDIPEGERKTVTALFADIKGSMELMEDLDPEDARAIVDPALKLMIDAVHRYGGFIVQSTGDGIFALFGAPVAHEDHPQRALLTALRLPEQLGRYSSQLRGQGRMPLQARVGVNTGDVVVRSIETGERHTEYTPIGHSTSLAARIQTLAPVGSIATTDTTRKLCEGYFTFKSLGPTMVKGVSEPIEVYELTGLGPLRTKFQRAEVRGLTKFVGRQREMEALKRAAEQARAGHGQIVAVMADPGVGKSRLFYEFKATSQSEWTMLEGFSVSYGKASAYLPVLELLSAYFEISRDDDERKRRERILGKVLGLDRSLDDTLPYLYSLYGLAETGDSLEQMEPRIRRRRIQEAIKRIVLRESLNQPLMVIFEDLHWIDSETQALLDLLVEAIANARILLLLNYRPEYRHVWASRTHCTELRLDPLGRESAEEMLSALLGDDKDLSSLKRQIVERTQGTPFFMEEMVQALFEEGVLQRNGSVKLAKPMHTVKVPASVQAVLASRIDRLPPAEKELLQTMAVLGREFPLSLVERVWQHTHPRVTALAERQASAAPLALSRGAGEGQPELEQMLNQLELGEFIFEQSAASDDLEYIFKHALTQEVAYSSLLSERRRALHDRAAQAIEYLYGDQLEDHYGDLANHYLRGNDTSKATRYAELAAEQAMSRGAYQQAAVLIEAALNVLEKLPEGTKRSRVELELHSKESTIAFVLHGASSRERERPIRRMCELAERVGEGDQLVHALSGLSNLYYTRGKSARGLELAERCLMLGNTVRDNALLVDLHYNAGMVAWRCGKILEAASYQEQALHLARMVKNSISPGWGMLHKSIISAQLALDLLYLGRLNAAFKLAAEGVQFARESKHMLSLGAALAIGGAQFALDRKEPNIALTHCDEAISLSEETGFAEWLPWGRFIHGWALFELGQVAQGLQEMEAGLAGFEGLGGVPRLQYLIAVRAEAIARSGRVDEALLIINRALVHIEENGDTAEQAEMLRLKGEVLLMRYPPARAEAEKCFREALEVARVQEAKWWELRSSASLARLLRHTDRRDEAHAILAPIYHWFTEGFELPDLKEARVLLDELRT
jgi:class 3 adenylate cyclase